LESGILRYNRQEGKLMNARTYKAAIYRGIGGVDVVDLPYPDCGDDDAIIRTILTGVCGSDVAAYRQGGDAHLEGSGIRP
jgi:threonine dehydrogenase-like Zn-dependent dehydrogenase